LTNEYTDLFLSILQFRKAEGKIESFESNVGSSVISLSHRSDLLELFRRASEFRAALTNAERYVAPRVGQPFFGSVHPAKEANIFYLFQQRQSL
jgi:hypothetical protein